MEKKMECEIVQDLLIGYVDNILNGESKKLVEKHLSECESCRERLKEIMEDIKQDENSQQKEIDYLKKIRMKSKIKSIIIALVSILIIILGAYFIKFIKISNIMNKGGESLKSQNYYSEMHQIIGNGEVAISKLYYKDGKYKEVSEIYSDDGKEIQYVIYGEEGTDERIQINEKNKSIFVYRGEMTKLMNQEVKFNRFTESERYSLTSNLGKTFIMSIDTDTYGVGKEYYIIRNQFDPNQRTELWIDKETGLVIKEINREAIKSRIAGTDIFKEVRDLIREYKYEFDIVTDEDVRVPDFAEYKVEYREQ